MDDAAALAAALAACERDGWADLAGVVDEEGIRALQDAVADLVLAPLDEEVGAVRQAGSSAVAVVAGRPAVESLADRLERAAGAAGSPWRADELAVTAYGVGEGISPHRDNTFYEGFVAVVTLTGSAELQVVADRAGRRELGRWEAGPGHLSLFRGPRPGGEARPMHAVGPAGPVGRQVLVLRRNARGAGRGWGDG